MAVLVTGGAGYIGSHTCVELINAGQDVVSWIIFTTASTRRWIGSARWWIGTLSSTNAIFGTERV